MLEPNFKLPDRQVSIRETAKRLKLLDWFKECIEPSATGLIVSGSLSYGQNYSVKTTSDIDMQILINLDTAKELQKADFIDASELSRAIEGFRKGLYKQFSLAFKKDFVPMECHFWDEQAFMDAIAFKNEATPRLRPGIETPSTDYAYSFDRDESKKDYFGEMVEGFPVSDFPSYRKINGKLFLCRPITNILGLPLVVLGNERLDEAIDECWFNATSELLSFAKDNKLTINTANIANTLPGRNKMSEDALNKVLVKTKLEIEKQSQ